MTQIDPCLTERQQYWLKHIRACDAAGQPSVEYARENGIEVSAMYSARKALAEKGALPKPRTPRFQKAGIREIRHRHAVLGRQGAGIFRYPCRSVEEWGIHLGP